jgi:YD repeat-containing protein
MPGGTTLNRRLDAPPDRATIRGRRACAIVVGALSVRGLVAAEPLVRLSTPTVVVESVLDPARSEPCGGEGALVLTLTDVILEPGRHELLVSADVLPDPLGRREVELQARGAGGGPAEKHRVLFQGDVVNRSVLPVGHLFLQGIDLLGGHLVRLSTDLKLEGRHLALELTRTYAGSALALGGATGVRWGFTYGSRVTPVESCGLYVVTTSDGSSQTFRSPDGGTSFVPPKGYHTSLRHLPDGSFELTDKSATRHRFTGPESGSGRSRRLLFIEEPHGDRIELRYDDRGRLTEVSEVHPGGAGVRLLARSLLLAWTSAGGFDRVQSVEAPGLGLRAEYAYDSQGNLTTVARFDSDAPGQKIERYSYSTHDARDRHRLVAVTETDGQRMEYVFGPDGLVKELVDRPPKGGEVSTSFVYDRSRAREGVYRTTTKEGAHKPVVYVMNRDGSAVQTEETDEKGRRVVDLEWARDDILKLGEKDNRGYEARYGYDPRGNLVTSRTRARAGAVEEELSYEYDPRFNKLARKRDAKGRLSTWRLDSRTGDVLEAHEAEGKATRYAYDRQGNLTATEDAAGRTLFLDHDTYGRPTRVVPPSGKVEIREFDLRGRRYRDDADSPPPTTSSP